MVFIKKPLFKKLTCGILNHIYEIVRRGVVDQIMLSKVKAFIKSEVVLCVSALAALLSMLLTPPSAAYAGYIDWDVLMMLFSLMTVVAGLRASGLWDWVSAALLQRVKSTKMLAILMVYLCFFSAMLVTNDVALITFVPLCLAVLGCAGHSCVIQTIVLMTIAANLGSMATPIGNPQNLYLFSSFSLSFGAFEAAVLPLTALSAVLLLPACLTGFSKSAVVSPVGKPALRKRQMLLHCALFLVCLLAVLDILPVWASFVITAAVCALLDRKAIAHADYSLLLTFVFFFILAGNLAANEGIRSVIGSKIKNRELLFGAGISQVISNVPAAVLLSSFTQNWKGLLQGVNIGGLGTPVASLASLISYRLYARSENAQAGRYMRTFLFWNAMFLAVLLLAALFIL